MPPDPADPALAGSPRSSSASDEPPYSVLPASTLTDFGVSRHLHLPGLWTNTRKLVHSSPAVISRGVLHHAFSNCLGRHIGDADVR